MSPDISMCKNNTCPLRMTCYRFIAKPSEFMQSYGYFEWIENLNNVPICDAYWEIEN